jgi:hypothetical protein
MFIKANKGRGCTYNVTFNDSAGEAITPDPADLIHCKVLHVGKTPVFLVDSSAATANGSSFTKGAPINVLRLDAEDMTFEPGAYTIVFELTDGNDADDIKNAQRGVFYLEDT